MIRFKKDDGSNYPEWEENIITDLAETYIGLVTTMTEHYVDFGVPLIRNSDIKENRFEFKEPIFLDEEFATKNESRKHKIGDVITVHTGDVGTSAVINEKLDGSIGFATIVTRINNEKIILPNYLCWYFNSPKNKKSIISLITGDGRNNLNMKDFNKLHIPVPCLEEQQKIADFLSNVDDVISASEKEVTALEEQKKGAMQKIFSQEVRFKEDDGSNYPDWKSATFGDIFTMFQNNSFSRDQLNENSGQIQNIHYGDILVKFGSIIDCENDILPFINEEISLDKFRDESYIQNGDIIVADTAEDYTAGKVSEIQNVGKRKILSGLHTMLCRPQIQFTPCYLGHYLNSEQFHKQIVRLLVGTKVFSINKKVIVDTVLNYPCLEEQKKIADLLCDMDKSIDLAKQELEQWKELKKGLLQQLFE